MESNNHKVYEEFFGLLLQSSNPIKLNLVKQEFDKFRDRIIKMQKDVPERDYVNISTVSRQPTPKEKKEKVIEVEQQQ